MFCTQAKCSQISNHLRRINMGMPPLHKYPSIAYTGCMINRNRLIKRDIRWVLSISVSFTLWKNPRASYAHMCLNCLFIYNSVLIPKTKPTTNFVCCCPYSIYRHHNTGPTWRGELSQKTCWN